MKKTKKLLLVVLLMILVQFVQAHKSSSITCTEVRNDKKVFAHYMVCFPPEGGKSTIEDFKAEIKYAQEHGIDGFALNCGGWSEKQPSYKKYTLQIYQAAKELQSGFLLFISADFCCKLTNEEFVDMIETFRNHPNQFRKEGKPVISTFGGGRLGLNAFIESRFKGNDAIFFVPFYYPIPATELPAVEDINKTLSSNRTLDGFFYFGAAGTPEAISGVTEKMANIWRGAGKIFMAPVTPFYQGTKQPPSYRIFESRGFQGMAKEWEAAIKSNADWIEIVTWNDFNENSYIAPIKDFKDHYSGYEEKYLWLLSHAAFLEASKYYVNWFKAGKAPVVSEDELFYFYRVHTKNMDSKFGQFQGKEALQDSIFTTVYLKAPAKLSVKIDGYKKEYKLNKGVNNIATELKLGQPQFTLERNKKILIDKVGEYKISDENNWAEYNYFSGSGQR